MKKLLTLQKKILQIEKYIFHKVQRVIYEVMICHIKPQEKYLFNFIVKILFFYLQF